MNEYPYQVEFDEANILIDKVQKFKQYFGQMKCDIMQSPQKRCMYFIVSIKFIHQWKEYCLSTQLQRLQPAQMNKDIFQNNKLKDSMIYGKDYELVNQKIYQLFEPFTDKKIQNKKSYIWTKQLKTQQLLPYTLQCNYIIITFKLLRFIDLGLIEQTDLVYKSIGLNEFSSLQIFLNYIKQNQQLSNQVNINICYRQESFSAKELYTFLRDQTVNQGFNQYQIKNAGKIIKDFSIQIAQLQPNNFQLNFIVQIINKNQKQIFIQDLKGTCVGCKNIADLQFSCQCKKVKYCSQICLNNDKIRHLNNCTYAQEMQLKEPINMAILQNSRHGLVGLKNLGNTCFMNSCLQCLSHTIPLTQYFLNGYFEKQINMTNTIGFKGKVTKNYAKFIKNMWCLNQSVYKPSKIKQMIGNSQHDSQQFLTFLIDSLHQDLNRVSQKPYVQYSENMNLPQNQIASQSWQNYLKRNQSIITDLMIGQYQSIITCPDPDCFYKSKKFDSFSTVSLPIPSESIKQFYVIYENMYKENLKTQFKHKHNNAFEWIENACNAANLNLSKFQLYVVSQKQNIYKVGRQSMIQIVNKIQNQGKILFLIQKTAEQLSIPQNQRIQFTIRFSKGSKSHQNELFFKFPMTFDKRKINGYQIGQRILKFLYNQAYKQRKGQIISGQTTTRQYQIYEQHMKQKQIFKIYLRVGKNIIKINSRKVEIKFQRQIQLRNIFELIPSILQRQNIKFSDCQIDIRFYDDKINEFKFEKLKKFQIDKNQIIGSKPQQVMLQDCFEQFSQPEMLQDGNQWFCPRCKQLKKASKQISIYRAPKILILQLKRFKMKKNRKHKNKTFVKFQQELFLKPYVKNQKPIEAYKQQINNKIFIKSKQQKLPFLLYNQKSKPIYDLYAISNHIGQIEAGHYTAYAKNNGEWYKFDDNMQPTITTFSQIVTQQAYLLFYQRRQ